jgi:hypothetical protein
LSAFAEGGGPASVVAFPVAIAFLDVIPEEINAQQNGRQTFTYTSMQPEQKRTHSPTPQCSQNRSAHIHPHLDAAGTEGHAFTHAVKKPRQKALPLCRRQERSQKGEATE